MKFPLLPPNRFPRAATVPSINDVKKSLKKRVYESIVASGDNGMSTEEIAAKLKIRCSVIISLRKELEESGLIAAKTRLGKVVWYKV